MKKIIIVGSILVLSGCFGLLNREGVNDYLDEFAETDGENVYEDLGEGVQEEKVVKKKEAEVERITQIDPDEQKAAIYYANAACAVLAPEFWDDLFDEEDDTDEDTAFYRQHGYDNQEEAENAVRKHWGKDDFKKEVKRVTASRCGKAIENAAMPLDELLNGKTP